MPPYIFDHLLATWTLLVPRWHLIRHRVAKHEIRLWRSCSFPVYFLILNKADPPPPQFCLTCIYLHPVATHFYVTIGIKNRLIFTHSLTYKLRQSCLKCARSVTSSSQKGSQTNQKSFDSGNMRNLILTQYLLHGEHSGLTTGGPRDHIKTITIKTTTLLTTKSPHMARKLQNCLQKRSPNGSQNGPLNMPLNMLSNFTKYFQVAPKGVKKTPKSPPNGSNMYSNRSRIAAFMNPATMQSTESTSK